MNSKISSAIVGETIRVYIADTSELVKEARRIHNTSDLSTDAFSRALTASSIMGVMLKNDTDLLTLKIAGTNLIKTILITANSNGDVKGYISNPKAEAPLVLNKRDIPNAIGKLGNLTLIRDFGLKEPYVGISNLKTGSIDEDLSFYYSNSEQQPTSISLRTVINGENIISGGIFIQELPGISDEEKLKIKEASKQINNIAELLEKGLSLEEIIKSYFEGMNIEMLSNYETRFKCDCSLERISKALITVGIDELTEILEVDKGTELTCHFCNKNYVFSENDLQELIDMLKLDEN